MNWSTTVYTSLSSDTEPSIVVTFDSAKYVFNVGENTTRAVLQSGRGWKKVKGIFLTDLGTKRTSGIPGMLMSIADASARKIDFVGPTGLLHLLASMRLYTFRNTVCLNPVEVSSTLASTGGDPTPVYNDSNIAVYSIPILPTTPPASTLQPEDEVMDLGEDLTLKRKRDLSPDQPSKRLQTEVDSSALAPTPSLLDRFRDDVSFSSASLTGNEAQDWRRLVIDHMFTWKEPPPPPKKEPLRKKLKKGKGVLAEPVEEHLLEAVSFTSATHPSTDAESLPQIPHWAEDPTGSAETSKVSVSRRAKGALNPAGSMNRLPVFVDPSPKSTLAYVVVGPRVRGKFDAKRAEELGLQGRLRGRVAKGETVTFMVDDGNGGKVERVVKPEDCLGEQESPGVVIVLDVPTQAHIDSLTSSFSGTFLGSLRSKGAEDRKRHAVHIIYHFLGEGVLEDNRYKVFMNGFADETHHLVTSRHHIPDPLTFTSAGFSQLRLNQLDAEIFPLPKYNTSPRADLSVVTGLPTNTSILRANTWTEMRPRKPPAAEESIQNRDKFHPAVTSPDLLALPLATLGRFAEAQEQVQSILAEREKVGKESRPGDDVVVVPLGTSSAVSSRYRNVSGMLVQIPGRGNLLLDAGEGTWGQLARYFGTDESQPSNVWEALRELKCIFISHGHADHHAGVAKILAMRRQLNPPPTTPLYLIGVYSVQLYLREYSDIENLGFSDDTSSNGVLTVLNDAINVKQRNKYDSSGGGDWRDMTCSHRAAEALCEILGLLTLNTVEVRHRTKAFGLVLEHRDGWRLVYSGDTMPANNLVQAGQGATLLIHEATMGDDQEEMAHRKAHSTIGQAINIGKQMHAENVLLTHFSSRYPHMPEYLAQPHEDGVAAGPTVALALDHARTRVGDLWKMPLYFRAIEQSFWDTKEEGDEEEEKELLQASAGQLE
ncbi:hypothetical protein BV25DRAFT_1212589 [Artomyces pyxidatus]|uniref:Uncharacterized protein n=1 Tax=Artomyces pyxidatus TaxID=48021 RepID=A0ACB8SQJ4_9AGAM|nr:hypothetical protein BV25DRAFT_1212589 [Artomyces pyxidatus]